MAEIWWMHEQKYRGRTAELLELFRASSSADLPSLSGVELARLEGVATNTVLLLRENKTQCVRQEQTATGASGDEFAGANFASVKGEVDNAIAEVLHKKAEFSAARTALLATEIPNDITIDLTGDLTDKLLILAELRSSGILTDAEFVLAKNKLF